MHIKLCVVTYIESERGFHGAELVYLSLHEAGSVAAHSRHSLRLPVGGEKLRHAHILTPISITHPQKERESAFICLRD